MVHSNSVENNNSAANGSNVEDAPLPNLLPPGNAGTTITTTKKRKRKKDRKKDPNAPKRIRNAYNFYCMDIRKAVVAENPGISHKEINVLVGARWKAVKDNPDQCKKWNDKAAEDKLRYKDEMANYDAKPPTPPPPPPPQNGMLCLLPRPPRPPTPPPKNGTTPVQQLQQQQYTTLQPQSPFAALGSSSDAAVIRVSHAQRKQHQQQQHQLHAAALQQQYQFIVQHQQQQHLQQQLHATATTFAALQRQYRFAVHHQQQQQQQQLYAAAAIAFAAYKEAAAAVAAAKRQRETAVPSSTASAMTATKKMMTTIKKKRTTKKKAHGCNSSLNTQRPSLVAILPRPRVVPPSLSISSTTIKKKADGCNFSLNNDTNSSTSTSCLRTLNPITAQISKRPSLVPAVLPRVVVPSSSSLRSTTSTPTNTAATAAPPPSVFILPSTASTPPEKIVRFAGTTTEPMTTPPPCSTLSLSSSSSHSSTAVKSAVTASDTDTDTDTDTTTRQIESYFLFQAAILPSSLSNGLATIPEKLRQLFDRVASHKLKMLFPNKPQEEINQLLAESWKRLCDEKLSEVLNLQVQRYKAHEDLREQEWKKEKPNVKYSVNKKDPGMIGLVFDAPTDPAFETPTSQVVQEMDLFKELQLYLEREQYNSALPICSDAESFDKIEVFNWFHYPGHKDSQKCIEKGLLWRSKNGYIGECCLNYPYSKWAKLATMLDNTSEWREVYDKLCNRSAFWDACPVIGSNKCGGIHNNATIKDFVTKIFLAFRKKCRNLKHINVFGLAPGKYVREILQPMLQLNGITFSYNNHPQFFMQGGAKPVDAQNFCKTGLVNLRLALNMDPQTVVEYQARIDSDQNLFTTVVKTITPAEIERQHEWAKKYGQALFESKRGLFAEGGTGTSIFTSNDDELLVMYDSMFSLHKYKWQRIAMYMCSYNNNQCRSRMDVLLQRSKNGRIQNPSSLQKRLQNRIPPVTSYWRAIE